jgi:hypothetical protein
MKARMADAASIKADIFQLFDLSQMFHRTDIKESN